MADEADRRRKFAELRAGAFKATKGKCNCTGKAGCKCAKCMAKGKAK